MPGPLHTARPARAAAILGAILTLANPGRAAAGGAAGPPAGSNPVTAVRCGRLIDGVAAGALDGATVIIEGDRIVAVGASVKVPDNAVRIDLTDMTCLPGFIDVHTHLMDRPDDTRGEADYLKRSAADVAFRSIESARRILDAGFTSVRDVGTYHAFTDVALRDAIDRGDVVGPRMQVAGFYVTIPGGGGELNSFAPEFRLPEALRFGVANGATEVRQVVRRAIAQRVDLIKVIASGAFLAIGNSPQPPAFTEEEIRAAVLEAGKAGLRVAAHAHGSISIRESARAGVASVEHGAFIDEPAIREMKAHGTVLAADLISGPCIKELGRAQGWPEEYIRKQEESETIWPASIRRAYEAGVTIAFATDSAVCPHGDNGKQFILMQEWLGMTPMKAIQSATVVAATLMGWEDRVGSLRPGRYADLVAVPADPLANLRVLETVPFVMKGGRVVRDARGR
jgi:imidazolonepropionase-like amidohydrolase